jgi:hypothetical protein
MMKLKINKTFTKRRPRKKIRNQKNKNQIEKLVYDKLRLNEKIQNK